MNTERQDLAQRAFRRRNRQDRAAFVPALGVMLLVSPLLDVFGGAGLVFGMPVGFLYLFLVWAGLILLTWRLARMLGGR
ncbi:MAG: hypothetical protein AAGE76_12055 [Pseudomonadota bacterium]